MKHELKTNNYTTKVSAERTFQNILKNYKVMNMLLAEIANTPPEVSEKLPNLEKDEVSYLNAQTRLLKGALKIPVRDVDDIKELMDLWHFVTFHTQCDDDVEINDLLILKLHEFFKLSTSSDHYELFAQVRTSNL